MKKQLIIISILLLLAISGGIFLYVRNKKTTTQRLQTQIPVQSQNASENDGNTQEGEPTITRLDPLGKSYAELPESVQYFEVFQGTVGFKAQKKFLNATTTEVVGTTEDFKSQGWFDPASMSYYTHTVIDARKLKMDDEQNDIDVAGLFENPSISVKINVEDEESLKIGEESELQIPAEVTINGVTRSEIFDVTTTLDEENGLVQAKGETSIKMSNFNIETPSVAKLFNMDDELVIFFDIWGNSFEVQETEATE